MKIYNRIVVDQDLIIIDDFFLSEDEKEDLVIHYSFRDPLDELERSRILQEVVPCEVWEAYCNKHVPNVKQNYEDGTWTYSGTSPSDGEDHDSVHDNEDFIQDILGEVVVKNILVDMAVNKINTSYFDEYCKMKNFLRGSGRSIANEAGVHYNTYLNYSKGYALDPATWQRIICVCRRLFRSRVRKMKSVLTY